MSRNNPAGENEGGAASSPWNVRGWVAAFGITVILAWVNVGPALAAAACVALLASWILMRSICEPFSPTRITIPGFWFVTYLVFIFWPSFYVFSEQTDPARRDFMLATLSVVITVPAGWLLASFLLVHDREETERFFLAPVARLKVASGFLRGFYWLLGFSLVISVIYVIQVPTIPLLYLFQHPGDALELSLLREESFKLLTSPFAYTFTLLRAVFYPFLIMVSLGAYLLTRLRKWLWWTVVAGITGILFAALSLAKAPVAAIFLMVSIFVYYYRHGIVGTRFIVGFLILILLFPVAVVSAVYSGTNLTLGQLGSTMTAIGDRLFHIPAEMVYYYFEFFPKQMAYLHGRSINMLSLLMGWKHVDTPNVVGQYAFPFAAGSITANAAFIGDMNADFGFWGVLLGGILAGVVMEAFHIYMVRRRKTIAGLAAYAFLVVTFWFLHSTALPQLLASNGALLVVLLAWAFDRPAMAASEGAPASTAQAPDGAR